MAISASDLPVELVQEILLISAEANLKQAATLSVVSRHVNHLVKPVLFRTSVCWVHNTWPHEPRGRWLRLNGKYVKNILWGPHMHDRNADVVLKHCPNLTNVAIWLIPPDLPAIVESLSQLHLQRLSADFVGLFGGSFAENQAQLPMFANLTHLEMANACPDWASLEGIRYLPRLTHFSIASDTDLSVVQNTLELCKHLVVLILYAPRGDKEPHWEVFAFETQVDPALRDIDDPRLVAFECVFSQDWAAGAQGGRSLYLLYFDDPLKIEEDSQGEMSETELPLELVYEIFRFSAESTLKQAAVLARVSRDIHELVKPILFRTFVLWDEKSWPPQLDSEQLQKVGGYARSLLWGADDTHLGQTLASVLKLCPNLINIALWLDASKDEFPDILEQLSHLRPHRLSVDLHDLFGTPFQKSHAGLPMFSNLTHLEMANCLVGWTHLEGIQYLPRLTHFSLPSDTPDRSSTVRNVLVHCKHLRIFVLFETLGERRNWSGPEVARDVALPLTLQDQNDPRIVCFECAYLEEWEVGAQGGRDMWTLAEEIVERRDENLKTLTSTRVVLFKS